MQYFANLYNIQNLLRIWTEKRAGVANIFKHSLIYSPKTGVRNDESFIIYKPLPEKVQVLLFVSIAISSVYSLVYYAHESCNKLYFKCAFQCTEAYSRRLFELYVTQILPGVTMVLIKNFK